MITYKGKKYLNIGEMASALKVRPSMANHLLHMNGGKWDDEKDLNPNTSTFTTVEMPKQAEVKVAEPEITMDDILEDAKDGVLKDKTIDAVKKLKKNK